MIAQRRQWLLSESEGGPGEAAKAANMSWTLKDVTR